jgi:transposase
MPDPSDLSDQAWAILAPLLPTAKPGGRPRAVDLRRICHGRFHVLRSGCQPTRIRPCAPGFVLLPRRWVVERTFAWIGRNRRMSRNDEFLPATSEAWIYLSMIRLMLKRLAHEQVQPASHYRRVA